MSAEGPVMSAMPTPIRYSSSAGCWRLGGCCCGSGVEVVAVAGIVVAVAAVVLVALGADEVIAVCGVVDEESCGVCVVATG